MEAQDLEACVICQFTMSETSEMEINKLNCGCGHYYHLKCLQETIKYGYGDLLKCPNCGVKIKQEEKVQELMQTMGMETK
jgi:hypothetical protein